MSNFFLAIAKGLEFGIMAYAAQLEKDRALKAAKLELMEEWKKVHASNNAVDIIDFIDRVRQRS